MKTQTFNIALPEDLVKKADKVARAEFRNRSELIREALRVYLKNTEEWNELFEYGKAKANQINLKSEQDVIEIVDEWRHQK